MIRYLYTPTVLRQGRPRLLTRDEILHGRLQGFQSVFGYPEETQQIIAKQGNTRDIAHLPVYCDTMFVDFDDKDVEANQFRNSLCECGIGYTMYESGNRSFHFHIPVLRNFLCILYFFAVKFTA